ncbi:MAG: AraC family transcriptional regulator [Treponema sp.]|jgi:AraC-like DNA-binding protein|nr:AraC family transcriptional regulator [Treponema sp.]
MKKILFDDFVPKIFYLVFRKCPPDWRVRPHFVDDNDITYIIEGKARYTINGTVHNLGPGDLLCLTDGMEKEAVTFPQNLMHCFSVNFASMYSGSQSSLPSFPPVSHIGLRQDLIDLFRELTISWSNQQDGYTVKTRALLMLILHRLSEILIFNVDSKAGDYRINKATQAIALHYAERLTVKGLASQVQLDEVYFGHLFKKETGMTVHQYIMRIRIRNAENMLQTGNCKVRDAAEHCGFSDVVHFYKSFRALRGFPPSRCIPKDGGVDIENE